MQIYFNHNDIFRKCDAEMSKKKKKVEMTTCATIRTKLKYTLEKYALSLKPLV